MNQTHQSPGPWESLLGPGQVARLAPAAVPRWLSVRCGRVWLTRSGGGADTADIWLRAGEVLALPAGSEWVAEAWPEARMALLQAPLPRRCGAESAWRRWAGATIAAVHRFRGRSHDPAVQAVDRAFSGQAHAAQATAG
jgi:hypothetical protein